MSTTSSPFALRQATVIVLGFGFSVVRTLCGVSHLGLPLVSNLLDILACRGLAPVPRRYRLRAQPYVVDCYI